MRTTRAGHDVALLEEDHRRVVVGNDPAVDLEEKALRAFDDMCVGRGGRGHSGFHRQRITLATSPVRAAGGVSYDRAPSMPVRATKRGAERTPIGGDFDVVICGASFAGLAVARELRATRARVLVLDRYEIGERQTSACAAPTEWLRNLGLEASIRQTFGSLLVHTPHAEARWPLGWTFSTFDYRRAVRAALGAARRLGRSSRPPRSRGARHVDGGHRGRAHRPRRRVRARSSSTRSAGSGSWARRRSSRRRRGSRAGSRCIRAAPGEDLELWIDRRVIRAGYGWSFPAADELRVGVGSFDPHDHVKQPTVALADELGLPPDGYQGNWIPHKLRPAVEDGVFFAGDSAGHCLPLTAEGIRTAFYFGIACGRELRAVLEGRAVARGGAGALRPLLGVAPLEVRADAADAARGAAAAPARARRGGAGVPARRRVALGVRALPADRAAGVRAAGAAGGGARGRARRRR